MATRTGEEYLASLKDGREIWINDRKVEDVTAEPGFRHTARAVAEYYDFQNLPEFREAMTYETPDGGRAGMSFIEPRSKDDLRRRAVAFKLWAEVTCGLMGRAPDYMNACMMAFGGARGFLGQNDARFGENAYNYYLHCRDDDVCMTHTFVTPMIDRSKRLAEQEPYRTAGVVRETSDGIIVRGAKVVGTLAPFCNENFSLSAGFLALQEDEKQYAVSFAHPVSAPGVRWICRDVFDPERSHFDRPVAGRLDEMDCVCVYDDVFVPWEHVFVYQDLSVHNQMLPGMRFTESLGPQVLVKNAVKTRFLLGLAHLIAETTQVNQFINVQEKLGEILVYLWNCESLALAAVEGATRAENGLWYCNTAAINAGLRLYPEYYPRIMHIIQQIGASGYIATPQELTLEVLGPAIERYFAGASKDAKGRVQLFRLAWDFIGDSWGGRQELYERNFFGDNERFRALLYQSYDKSEAIAMVQRLLEPPAPHQPFAIPANLSAALKQDASA